ncbi:MAG: YdeI/OmpD-associated family protein [Elainella sp.]
MAKPAKPRFEDSLATVYASDRQAWRTWLAQNHQTSAGVWLVYYKVSSGKPSIRYPEAVQEALCFGWIDSKVKSLDAERYKQIFTPRQPQSVWSKLNKQYIQELTAQGLMTEAGLAKIRAAQQDGSWTSLDAVEALLVPEDLAAALAANPLAEQYFMALGNTPKKLILTWINSAKRPTTRQQRIEKTVAAAGQGRSPLER